MRKQLLLIALSCLMLLGSAEAMNRKALNYYGEVFSGTIFRGQLVTETQLKEYLDTLCISVDDIPPSKKKQEVASFDSDVLEMETYFRDESGNVQKDTINSILSYSQHASLEEQYGLHLLINKTIECSR